MKLYEVYIKYGNLYKEQKVMGFGSNLGFSLYAVLSAYYMVVTPGR